MKAKIPSSAVVLADDLRLVVGAAIVQLTPTQGFALARALVAQSAQRLVDDIDLISATPQSSASGAASRAP
jgi:hypothetical protein